MAIVQADLTEAERVAARMFFDVTMQSAFALEDPNSRFAVVFENKEAMGPKVATLADVPRRTYDAVVDGTELLFDVRPEDSVALSRVLIQSDYRREKLMEFLVEAMDKADYFQLHDLGQAIRNMDPEDLPPNVGNRTFRLEINADLNTKHDVAVMFVWGLPSDRGTMMEFSAWPIDKVVDETA
ncbi:MAG: hypothetical protein AAGK23_05745 [Pseudomonadota bacterium]